MDPLVGSIEKAQREFAWTCPVSLDEVVDETACYDPDLMENQRENPSAQLRL